MNQPEDAYLTIELDFAQEMLKRQIVKYPHSAKQIALQLLAKYKKQRQKQYELEQKYNELLTSYLDVNEAYLSTLKLLKNRSAQNKTI